MRIRKKAPASFFVYFFINGKSKDIKEQEKWDYKLKIHLQKNGIFTVHYIGMTTDKDTKSWLRIVIDILEAFFKSSKSTPRTWHQHVVPYQDGWAVRREGNKRITSKHRKQSTAITKAKRIAKKRQADVIIHRTDGTIRDRVSYGDD